MISAKKILESQNNLIRYFAISIVIFLVFSFIIILDRHSVVAQTTDKSVDSTFYSINNKTDLTKPSWLGLTIIDTSKEILNILQYHTEPGILVTDVTPNGPAFKAGIRGGNQSVSINGTDIKIGGDIILSIDNKSLDKVKFNQYLLNKTKGENVTLHILRDGKNYEKNLIVGEDPSQIYENDAIFKYPNNINFSNFQIINFSIKIEYPSSWEPSIEKKGIYFRSNYENSSDIARDYVKINVLPGESNSSDLVAYTGILSATTVNSTAPFSIGPYNGKLAIYSYLDPKLGWLKLMKAATIINGTGYLFSYYAPQSSFDNYLPTIERMFDTFRVINTIEEERFDLGIRFKYPADWTLRSSEALGMDNRYWSKLDLINERDNNTLALEISPQYDDTAEAKEVFDENIKNISDHLKFPIVKLASNLDHYRGESTYHVKFTKGDPQLGTLFGEQNIKLSNNRIYKSGYSVRQEDYSKTFGIINQILNSVQPFKILRYENSSLGIIYYYPSDWSKSDEDSDLFYNPSSKGVLFHNPSFMGDLNLYQLPTLQKNGSDNATVSRNKSCNMNFSLSDQPLNTTLGEKIYAPKIISSKNETYQTLFGDKTTRQVQEMIVCYNLRGKTYVANYSETTYPGDASYLSTAEKIINSSKLIDYIPVSEITTEYNNSDFVLRFPQSWNKLESNYGLALYPPYDSATITIGPVIRNNTDINQILSSDLQNQLTGYGSINSTIIKHNNIPGYRIEFQDTGTKYLNMYLISYNNTYPIYYQAPIDKYFNYLPEVEYLINSFRPIINTDFKFTGYRVGGMLTGIAVNPNNNMLYVADNRFNLVHVRDGANNNIIDIPVGKSPEGIAVDPNLNTVYVSNVESNSISIIDGTKNIVNSTIQVGEDPLIVAVNPITHMVYVGDASTHVLYRIDGISHKVSQIWTGGTNTTNGVGVAINEITGNVYVANPDTQNVTVVDGKEMKILSNISIEGSPIDIAINSLSNMGYVVTWEHPGVFAIDLSTNTTNSPQYIENPDAFRPNAVTVNRLKNLVYITDFSTNSKIHVLDISNGNKLNMSVDPYPAYLAVNYGTGITYVSTTAGTVSTIDNDANQITYGIRYHINSNISGSVFCNGKKISNNYYTTYLSNETVACSVNSTNYFSPILSTSWKLDNNSTNQNTVWPSQHLVSFKVTEHDTMNVSMEDINSLIHRWGSFISLATVTSVVIIASIPTIIFRGKAERGQGKYVLERDEILGINASVIVGVLVFLSLEGFNESQQSEITFVTASIVFPFAISVITTILGRNYFATRLMIAGFVNLMISIILIVSLRYRP